MDGLLRQTWPEAGLTGQGEGPVQIPQSFSVGIRRLPDVRDEGKGEAVLCPHVGRLGGFHLRPQRLGGGRVEEGLSGGDLGGVLHGQRGRRRSLAQSGTGWNFSGALFQCDPKVWSLSSFEVICQPLNE